MITTTTKGGIISSNSQNTPAKGMQDLIKTMEPQIAKALPSVLTPERFTRMVLTALSSNPNLKKCTPSSFLGAMMQAAQLGVEPNTPLGQAYLIPYNSKRGMECQFQLGYKGLIDLAYRSGDVTIIQAHAVYENDEFEYELGLEPKLFHKPTMSNRGAIIAYYAMFKTKTGGSGFSVMSKEDIEKHRDKYSKSAGRGISPWQSDFDAMAKKTVLKQCLKYAPIKTDFVRQIATDETVKSSIDENMTAVPDEFDYGENTIEVNVETGEIIDQPKEK